MLQQERHEQILARLNTDGKVKVKELAVDFEVTEDCIRKDLTALEKEGLLKRIHGGAMQVRKNLHRKYSKSNSTSYVFPACTCKV